MPTPPLPTDEGRKVVKRRHDEWQEHVQSYRFLLDSLEGGERYRRATYGSDTRGLPVRNLIRHKREYPQPGDRARGPGLDSPSGSDAYTDATDDDYELRRARTPVPTFVAEAVGMYLGKIYGGEVDRDAENAGEPGERVAAWWADVDGRGTSMDQWMSDLVAPLLLTFGHLDLCFDHPPAPAGAAVGTLADQNDLGLSRCVASYVLPENMVDWTLTPGGRDYADCVVLERGEGDGYDPVNLFQPFGGHARFRHWTAEGWTLYDARGAVLGRGTHDYGRVPIVRVFDRRNPRCGNVGVPRFGGVAERQREDYNRASELILSDTTQAHPLLQGPEDYIQADGTVPIGPSWLLPKKKNSSGGAASYEGFEVVDFPKGAADSIRANRRDLRDEVDRDAGLVKPAGAVAGTGAGTVAQSGVSKAFDHDGLHAKLSKVARVLAGAENRILPLVLLVLYDGDPPEGAASQILVSYPTVFSLYSADDLAKIAADFQLILGSAGAAPTFETAVLCEIARKALPGRDDATYEAWDGEIESAVARKATDLAQTAEAGKQIAIEQADRPVTEGDDPAVQAGAEDPPQDDA